MTTVTQRLAFLISANADQAIKAFDKTANSAEKQLGKASKSIDKLGMSMTKFGAAGLAAAGTLGAGLAKLAQGAIEDQKAQALLADQLKKSAGATDAQIKKVEEFIDSTARATGVVDDMLRPALQTLVRTTGDVGQAQNLLKIAMDVSAGSGRDLSSVVTAMSRAALGNFSALTRLGIPIDENTKKSKDFNRVLDLLTGKFGGQAAVAADTYAGKMARAKVAIGEAGEQLGSAFIPFVEKGATTVASVVNGLSKFDQATGGAVGKLAAFGTVGLGAVSALSLIGGQAIKLRDRFTTLSDDGTRSLNMLGQAAKYTAGALATIGLSEAVFSVLNEVNDSAGKADRSLQQLNKTLAGTSTEATVAAFEKLVKAQDDTLKLSHIWSDFGKEIKLAGTDSKRNIEDIDAAFTKLLKESGPKAAQLTVDALKAQNATLDTSSQQYKDNAMLVARYQARIDDLTGSTAALKRINDGSNASLEETKSKYQQLSKVLLDIEWKNVQDTFEKLKQKQEDLKAAAAESTRKQEEFKQSVLDAAGALKTNLASALDVAKGKLKDAQSAYDNYVKSVSGAVTGTLNLGAAQGQAVDNAKAIAEAQQKVTDAQAEYDKANFDLGPDREEKLAEARKKLATATTELNDALSKPTDFMGVFKGQEAAAKAFAGNLQKLLDLGADRAVIDQLLSAGADTGNQIAESILKGADPAGKVAEINGIVASTQKIADDLGTNAADKYFKNGVTLAENLVSGINSVLKRSEIRLTWKALNKDGKPMKNLASLTDLFQSRITGMFETAGVAAGDIPQLADGGVVKARSGGTLALLGEGGRDEAVLPLPSSGALGGTTINVTVSAGMGSDGTQIGKQIVDELVAYQRRVGALPIKVVS